MMLLQLISATLVTVQMIIVTALNDQQITQLNITSNGLLAARSQLCSGVNDPKCNQGQCQNSHCLCNSGWITWNSDQFCTYAQKSKLEAFLLSFFVGIFGVDWFVLSRGNAVYIVAGVFKLLTGGGVGIWWLVDWIRLLADSFVDGNGAPLKPW